MSEVPGSPPVPWKQLVLFLLLPALALRLLMLAVTSNDPIVVFPVEDGLSYTKWAAEIAGGDLLGRNRPVFYQAPLYPYLLALLQVLGLGAWPWPQVVNVLAGTATVAFVFLTAHRLFGAKPAWIAGGAMALWGPALMYECLTDKTALGLCVCAASLWALVELHEALLSRRIEPQRCAGWCLLVGVLLGAGAMLRENLIVLAPVAAVFLWIRTQRFKPSLGLLGGLLLGLSPVLLHNGLIGGEWLPTTYQAGTNFYIGNHEGAEGTYEALVVGRGDPIYEEADARRLAAAGLGKRVEDLGYGEVNRYWLGEGIRFAKAQPYAWLELQFRKLQWFVFHAEAPDTVPYDGFRAGLPWLLPSRLLFGLLLPLAVLGAWLVGREAKARFVGSLALVACGSVIAFYVVSRYRLACLPFLLPFAARAVVELRTRPLLAAIALICAIPAQVWLPSRPPAGLDAKKQEALLWVNRGVALGTWTQDSAAPIAAFERALSLEPDLLAAHRALSRAMLKAGNYEGALPHCEHTVRLAQVDLEARHNLGFCLQKLDRLARAEHEFRIVLETAGEDVPAVTVEQLARVLERRGKRKEAEELRAKHAAPAK